MKQITLGTTGITVPGDGLYVATKTAAKTPEALRADLETSLRLLQRDYIDIYQFHMAGQCYRPGDGTGMYEAMLEAKAQGKIRHIGITAHKIGVAEDIIASGLYETLQYPFSYLSTPREAALAESCRKANMGLIAMKALAGGLVTNAYAAFAYIAQYDNVLPIWGIQRPAELEQWLGFFREPASLPALPGRDPDQPVRAHLPDDPPRAVRELAGPRHAGRNGEDRALPRLWPVQEPLSL